LTALLVIPEEIMTGFMESVVVLVSVQGVQGCAKWGPQFSIYAL